MENLAADSKGMTTGVRSRHATRREPQRPMDEFEQELRTVHY